MDLKGRTVWMAGFLAILVSCLAPAAYANLVFTVTLNTSALVGNVNTPFSLAFVLIDGSGSGDGLNTVSLSDFTFGGGNAGSVNSNLSAGGESGSLTSGVSLTDTSFFNALVSTFTPGSVLSFAVDMTTNVISGGTPDEFSFSLLENCPITAIACSNVPTTDPTGADSLLSINIDSSSPTIQTFASSLTPPPTIPEPPTLFLLAIGLTLIAILYLRRRRKSPLDS
jgi:hypothetical protein